MANTMKKSCLLAWGKLQPVERCFLEQCFRSQVYEGSRFVFLRFEVHIFCVCLWH